MKYEKEIETPGWRPADEDERQAVVDYCTLRVGMEREEADRFLRFNAVRMWSCCDGMSVADAARRWQEKCEELGRATPPPLHGGEGGLEKLTKEVVELRKAVDQIAVLLCLVHGKEGETDIGRVVAEMVEERDALRKLLERYRRHVVDRRGVCGLEGEAVDQVERVDPGAERVGGER